MQSRKTSGRFIGMDIKQLDAVPCLGELFSEVERWHRNIQYENDFQPTITALWLALSLGKVIGNVAFHDDSMSFSSYHIIYKTAGKSCPPLERG